MTDELDIFEEDLPPVSNQFFLEMSFEHLCNSLLTMQGSSTPQGFTGHIDALCQSLCLPEIHRMF
jgi:hypothetical protein